MFALTESCLFFVYLRPIVCFEIIFFQPLYFQLISNLLIIFHDSASDESNEMKITRITDYGDHTQGKNWKKEADLCHLQVIELLRALLKLINVHSNRLLLNRTASCKGKKKHTQKTKHNSVFILETISTFIVGNASWDKDIQITTTNVSLFWSTRRSSKH